MSQPLAHKRFWVTASLLGAFVAYEGAHYATNTVMRSSPDMGYPTHAIVGKELPSWVDSYFFWPAERLDELIGVSHE
jgi:hypothetical protein